MSVRTSTLALAIALAGLTACSGGGSGADVSIPSCDGSRVNAMCLVSCSLGCRGTRCEITDIAQNENIVLVFNTNVDPLSVNPATIQFRTSSGDQPVGSFLVNNNVVEFVPQVLIVGGQSFFGFRAGETYSMTLPGGTGPNTVRSTSGDPLKETISCTLAVTRGIIDLNGAPPRANLVSPTTTTGVPRDITIQLEFNEIVDATPFLNSTGANGPIVFALRRTRINTSGVRECSPVSQPVPMSGSPRIDLDVARSISIVTFQPALPLPGNICVEVSVTDRVRDLAGNAAQPQVFQFLTVATAQTEEDRLEEFTNADFLDRDASAGTWDLGFADFGALGGDGRHGPFDTDLGTSDGVIAGKRTYTINTNLTVIPDTRTVSGNPIVITDGRFFFDKMIVPSDVRLRFTGTSAPQIVVSGRCDIAGEIDVQGQSTPFPSVPATSPPTPGQPGGLGGIFAGSGGRGGNRCSGLGASPDFNGQPGGDARVLGGHGFATTVVGSGGRGSAIFPADGLNASILFGITTPIGWTPMATGGGGGGGYVTPGGLGRVVGNNHLDPILLIPPRLDMMGPSAAGGGAVTLFPVPAGIRSSVQFLVGGSGGGGSGSHPLMTNSFTRTWAQGAGGGGGGGAVSLRAGHSLRLGSLGSIRAQGGSTAGNPQPIFSSILPSPAGAGSGGSVVLQSGGTADIAGLVDVRGGTGGTVDVRTPSAPPGGAAAVISGGAGSPGFVRLETPGNPTLAALPNMQPAPTANNVAPLAETDDLVMFRSIYYSTNQVFGPEFVRYEIRAIVDGVPILYSDDPTRGTPAQFGQAPIQALWMGATLDLATGLPIENELRAWRPNVGSFGSQTSLAEDGRNGFRFMLVLDRTAGLTVRIDSVKVIYRV